MEIKIDWNKVWKEFCDWECYMIWNIEEVSLDRENRKEKVQELVDKQLEDKRIMKKPKWCTCKGHEHEWYIVHANGTACLGRECSFFDCECE